MRFRFQDVRRPARMAKLVRAAFAAEGLNIGLSRAQDVCARLYGYATYHELKSTCSPRGASPWDEQIPAGEATARAEAQAASLVADGLPMRAALGFVAANRPTGTARRQGAARTAGVDGDDLRGHGFADHLLALGLAGRSDLAAALREQMSTGELIGGILVRNGIVTPSAMVEAILGYGVPGGRRGAAPDAGPAMGDHDGDGYVARIVERAAMMGLAEFRIEPGADGYAVSYGQGDGYRLVHLGSRGEYEAVARRIGALAGVVGTSPGTPQLGRIVVACDGGPVDATVRTDPSPHGLGFIVSIAGDGLDRPVLDDLKIANVAEWRRGITRKNGLCLIFGEAGSGKTTALNASVRELDRFGKKIYTTEDPVEFRIPYVGQLTANSSVGYGFAQSIRNFMDADPNVMILGEIRDGETARNAVRAAETGHLVIGTIHAKDAAAAVRRMRDFRVPAHELRFVMRALLSLVPPGGARDGSRGWATHFTSYTDFDRFIAPSGHGADAVPVALVDDAIARMKVGQVTAGALARLFGDVFLRRMRELGLDPDDYESMAA